LSRDLSCLSHAPLFVCCCVGGRACFECSVTVGFFQMSGGACLDDYLFAKVFTFPSADRSTHFFVKKGWSWAFSFLVPGRNLCSRPPEVWLFLFYTRQIAGERCCGFLIFKPGVLSADLPSWLAGSICYPWVPTVGRFASP